MLAGQTATYQGSEVALLPFDYVYITQNSAPGAYSHCCGHATDFAFPTTQYPIYAPFSCHETSPWESTYTGRTFTSDAPVWTPNHGLTYVTVRFVHDTIPMSGTHFNQGELIAHSGQGGSARGDHCHMDTSPIANATLVYYGVTCGGYGNRCYALSNSALPSRIFYTTGDENIVNTTASGITLSFKQWDGGVTPPQPPDPPAPPPSIHVKKLPLWWKYLTVRRTKGFFIKLKSKRKRSVKQWQLRPVMNC